MSKEIQNNDFVDPATIKTYQDIDGLKVIEDLLLFKGVEIAGADKVVRPRDLDDMALVSYGLKVNATNRLHVGMALDKFFLRAGLTISSTKIKVPIEIYDRVKELNDRYKTKDNQQEE